MTIVALWALIAVDRPPIDRDECRFAQASRQMFESATMAAPVASDSPAGPPTHPGRDDRPIARDSAGDLRGGFHAGGLVVPMLQDRPRLNKPPMIYWLQAASAAIFTAGRPERDAIWMYRLPSVLAVAIAAWATYRIGRRLFDRRTGTLAAAMLAVCPVVSWEAAQARADMVLLAFTTVAMLALWEIRLRSSPRLTSSSSSLLSPTGASGTGVPPVPIPSLPTSDLSSSPPPLSHPTRAPRSWLWPILFWFALGAGILTKGPITPLIAGLTAVAFSVAARDWRWLLALRPLLGVAVLAAMIAPWAAAVGGRIGWDTYLGIIRDEVLGRSVAAKEGHWGPPGYHTLLFGVLFWPGSLLTGWGMWVAWRRAGVGWADGSRRGLGWLVRWKRKPNPSPNPLPLGGGVRGAWLFLIAWIVPAWMVFELVSTKLPHYTMPIYPALAVVSARAVNIASRVRLRAASVRGLRLGVAAWVTVGLGLALSPIVLAIIADAGAFAGDQRRAGGVPAVTILTLGWAFCVWWLVFNRRKTTDGWRPLIEGSLIVALIVPYLLRGPIRDMASVTPRLAEALNAAGTRLSAPAAAVSYHEDSLVFLTRGRVERIDFADTRAWATAHGDGFIVLPRAEVPAGAHVVARVAGFNYSKGRSVDLAVVRASEWAGTGAAP